MEYRGVVASLFGCAGIKIQGVGAFLYVGAGRNQNVVASFRNWENAMRIRQGLRSHYNTTFAVDFKVRTFRIATVTTVKEVKR